MATINLLTWFTSRGKAADTSTRSGIGGAQRERDEMGPWTSQLGGFVARQINPALFEALREAVPIIDAGIGATVALDGIVRVEGNNQALVDDITAWMETVRVNDAETGLQAFYANQGNELYEQGFGVGEWTASKDGKSIAHLRVADSKGVVFLRDDTGLKTYYRAPTRKGSGPSGMDTVEAVLRGATGLTAAGLIGKDFVELDPRRLVYVVHQPEGDNPYGTSKIRSLEVVAQVLLRIDNAIGRVWTRYGDPPLHMSYKTKNAKLGHAELEGRRKVLATELAAALQGKESGNSIDLVTATGMLDEIGIDVIGAAAVVMDASGPLKHITEQVCAKFELPPWLLGVDGTVGAGQAERQAEMVLQGSRIRWERRRPGLTALVSTHLRLAGRTWARGDWQLVQELPNIRDRMKEAQANFLDAQAASMTGRSVDTPPRGIDNNLRGHTAPRGKRTASSMRTKATGDDDIEGEPWADDADGALARIERRRVRDALKNWWRFAGEAAAVLGFDVVRNIISGRASDDGSTWSYPRDNAGDLLVLEQQFLLNNTRDDAPVLGAMWNAWVHGSERAAGELSVSAEIASFQERVRAQLNQRGGELVRSAFARAYRERIFGELAGGSFDGMNPLTVAAALQRKFEAGEYDWERLIRSEMAIAQSRAKHDMYIANGVAKYDYTTANDNKVSAICLSLAAEGPYSIDDPNAPIPVVSSHPNCRCAIAPHIED